MRAILNKALRDFCQELPVVFVLTVVSADAAGTLHTRGLYATTAARLATATSAQDRATSATAGLACRRYVGTDDDCYEQACKLSAEVERTP